jgi:hypothetical protein
MILKVDEKVGCRNRDSVGRASFVNERLYSSSDQFCGLMADLYMPDPYWRNACTVKRTSLNRLKGVLDNSRATPTKITPLHGDDRVKKSPVTSIFLFRRKVAFQSKQRLLEQVPRG